MVSGQFRKNEIAKQINNFVKNICEKKGWDKSKIEKIFSKGIEINAPKQKIDKCKCIANVPNPGTGFSEFRQCTRKKKFGNYCGLHNNVVRKGGLKYGTIFDARDYKKEIIFLQIQDKKKNVFINSKICSDINNEIISQKCIIDYFNESNYQNKWDNLYWKGIKYLINEKNEVFYDDYDDLINIGVYKNGIIVN